MACGGWLDATQLPADRPVVVTRDSLFTVDIFMRIFLSGLAVILSSNSR